MVRAYRLALATIAVAMPIGAAAQPAILFDGRHVAGIVHDGSSPAKLAGEMLGGDITRLTGRTPVVSDTITGCDRLCIVIGTTGSPLVRGIAADAGVDLAGIDGGWERYARVLVRSRRDPSRRYLLIAGSDPRGAVWGVVDLTRELGVSAWEWWADVTPRRVGRLAVDGARRVSASPSVRYRGIFLNDEDWGLQPWAAKTHEPGVGDIGPKTYGRIFQLLWRLKANLIWPAMHDSTTPFYQVPGNADAARDHAIVVGTSHAEPMMRNNVREWDEAVRGPFNFFTNRRRMVDYWRERVDAVKGYENIYSIGLRGKHDSAMEGADTPDAARQATADAIAVQRELLAEATGRPASRVPQALTLYKEVLDVYGGGLKVPDDVTLVWPEDNYGYINRLPTPQEQARPGGSGLYYHLSYWGRPHDYLWLATTHPALVREQLERAAALRADRLWVVNVGDIKPGEYLMQYFLDLAFDRTGFAQTPAAHLSAWAATQFGAAAAPAVADVLTTYYDLAFERRPEFMGFSGVEPVTPVRTSDYVRSGGAEAERRIDRYAALVRRAEALAATMPADRRDAFFELVLYPVRGAASLNERILKSDLATVHAAAGRADAVALSEQARAAQARIVANTATYNGLAGGKWRGIMHAAPRGLPVFREPPARQWPVPPRTGCAIEGDDLRFVGGQRAVRGFTLYSGGLAAAWHASGQRGVRMSAGRGRLTAGEGFRQRLTLAYDGSGPIAAGTIRCGGRTIPVPARLVVAEAGMRPALNAIVTLPATDAAGPDWQVVPGLGSTGAALRSRLDLTSGDRPQSTPLQYRFDAAGGDTEVRIVTLPMHPLTARDGMRVAVRIDDGPLRTLDYRTIGRSDEWKANVLRNAAIRSIALPRLAAGQHRIALFALDPGFVLDRIEIRSAGAAEGYGMPLH